MQKLQQQVDFMQATQQQLQQQLALPPLGQPTTKRPASTSDDPGPRPAKRTNQALPAPAADQASEDLRLAAAQVEVAALLGLAKVSLRPGMPLGLKFAGSARSHGHEPMGLCLVCWRDVGRGAYCCDEDCEGI